MGRVSHLSAAPQVPVPVDPSQHRDWVQQIIEETGSTGPLDARQILSQHPSLRCSKSAVLDLAYEEYCRRVEGGEELDVEQFVQRFDGYQTSLIRQIEAHRDLVAELPQLLAASTVWPLPGEEFLGFRLREELGRGAFSRVFLADELALGDRPVVAKVSRFSGLEPHALGRLRHPHIVPVHSIQVDERRGLSLICMPFFGRATLCDLLDCAFQAGAPPRHGSVVLEAMRRADPVNSEIDEAPRKSGRAWWATSYTNAVLNLAVQITEALQFAHGKGIFHCDLKPSNVLLCPPGAKLFDFNLALGKNSLGSKGGTLPYMAPEQLRVVTGEDRAARMDAHTDLFSLGIVLHELFTGNLPWGRVASHLPADLVAAELLHRYRRGAPPLERVAGLNPSLARLIESCLAYRTADRPASARELATGLRAELSALRRGARLGWQHRRVALTVMGAVLLGSAGAGYAWKTAEPYALHQERLGRKAFDDQQFDRAIRHFEAALRESPDHHAAWFLRGRARMLLGRYDEAREDFAYLNQLAPSDAFTLACLGTCHAAKTRPDEDDYGRAALCLRKALQSLPNNAALWNNLGYCDQQANRIALAQERFKKAVALNGSEPISHYHLAYAALRRALAPGATRERELSLAREQIERAIEWNPRIARFHLLSAEILCWQLDCCRDANEARQVKIEAALDRCESAWDVGCPAEELALATSSWVPLRAMDRYQSIPNRKRMVETPARVAPLLDPLADVEPALLRLSE